MIIFLKKSLKDENIKELEKFEKGCWINVENPSHNEVDDLVKEFKLNEENLMSGLDPHETSRVDFVGNDTYIFIKIPPVDLGKDLSTLLIVIRDSFIMTLSKQSTELIKGITNNNNDHFYTTQRTKFLLHLLSLNNDAFENRTLDIVKSVEMKKYLSKTLTEKDVNDLVRYEYILNNFELAYSYTNFMYNKIIHKLGFFDKDKDGLEELIIETEEGENICKTSLKNITNIRNYSMILLTSKLNKLISILTVFMVFLSFVSAISGVYSMNVETPFQDEKNAFFYITTFIMLSLVGLFYYLKKKKII